MSNSQYNDQNEQDEQDEQDDLQKYLEEKAKQEQENQQQQEAESLSEYDACVIKESAKIHELIAEAQRQTSECSEDE